MYWGQQLPGSRFDLTYNIHQAYQGLAWTNQINDLHEKIAGRSCNLGALPSTFSFSRWRAESPTSDEIGARECADRLRCAFYLIGQCTTFFALEAGGRSGIGRKRFFRPCRVHGGRGGGVGHGFFSCAPPYSSTRYHIP